MQLVNSLGDWYIPPWVPPSPTALGDSLPPEKGFVGALVPPTTLPVFPCSDRRCRPTAAPARQLGPPQAQCHSSCKSMVSSRVSPSPKRCQAKAGSSWGEGSWPGGLCSLLGCSWELRWGRPVRAGRWGSCHLGLLASTSASLRTQHPHLNNDFCPGAWGQGG